LPHWHLSKTAVPRDPANRHDERLKFCSGETKISWKANTLAFFLASARIGAPHHSQQLGDFTSSFSSRSLDVPLRFQEAAGLHHSYSILIPRLYNDIIGHHFYRIPGISAAFSKLRRL